MAGLNAHLAATDRASMFDAFERAATQGGLALFVVHIDAPTPTVVYASELAAELVGRPVRDLVGRPVWELVAHAQQDRVREIIASRGPGAPPITLEFVIERPDGTRRDIEVGVSRITTTGAELGVCYVRDITDVRQTIEALRRSETRFRSLIEHAPDGVVIVQDGRISLANPVAVRMFGASELEQVRGRLLSDYLPPDDAARALERIAQLNAGAAPAAGEYRVIPTNLIVEVLSVNYEYENRPAVLTFVRDVTERKRMQEQLFHADRLAAMGTMAATVAHEINNPLTYLQLSLQRLEMEISAESDPARAAVMREHVTNALHGAGRVATIVRDLRRYTHDNRAEPEEPSEVVPVVERALRMVDNELRHRARLVRRYPAVPVIVDVAAGKLEQVVINLLVNAVHAIEGNDPGRNQITVSITEGHEVTITISDTGAGSADSERVFEPFFTSKPIGQGVGLGLSVCKQIVESMRGRITFDSAVGRGTTVSITLPRHASQTHKPAEVEHQVSPARLRILVIDDEPLVRRAMTVLLADYHRVDDVEDGESALAMIGNHDYDVILCDLMMPGLGGREVYERVLAKWPALTRRMVFVTGGAFIPTYATFLDSVDNLKLNKPFTREQALAIVQQAHRRALDCL